MTRPTQTCCLILNWNGWKQTLDCLNSLLRLSSPPSTILICDNASKDDSLERILDWAESNFAALARLVLKADALKQLGTESTAPGFVFIQNPANLGFAGGNNQGLRWALRQNRYDFLWLLNNDTIVEPEAYAALIEAASSKPEVGIWGSSLCWLHEPDTLQCAGGCRYAPLTTVFRPILQGRTLEEARQSEPGRLDYILGASMFVRSEVFKDIGLLNEAFFLFYEELDLCRKARRAGYGIEWCRGSLVWHHGSASIGRGDQTDRNRLRKVNYHETLSTLCFTREHYPWLLPLVFCTRFFGKAVMLIKRRQFFLIAPLCRAYRDFFLSTVRRDSQRQKPLSEHGSYLQSKYEKEFQSEKPDRHFSPPQTWRGQ